MSEPLHDPVGGPDVPVVFATESLTPPPVRTRLWMTVAPVLGFPLAFLASYLAYGARDTLILIGTTIASFVGAGKLVILTGAIDGAPFGVWPLALVVVYGDMATALVMVANLHYLYGLPLVGIRLAAARAAGARFLRRNRWMQRTARLGLVLFIAGPFQGTGAVLGVIIGGLLGLTRASILGSIAVGSALGAGLLAGLGEHQRETITSLTQRPALGISLAVFCLIAAAAAGRWLVRRDDKPAQE